MPDKNQPPKTALVVEFRPGADALKTRWSTAFDSLIKSLKELRMNKTQADAIEPKLKELYACFYSALLLTKEVPVNQDDHPVAEDHRSSRPES